MAQHSLSGKVVVLTGASSGFGKGAALELARRGARRPASSIRRPRTSPTTVTLRAAATATAAR